MAQHEQRVLIDKGYRANLSANIGHNHIKYDSFTKADKECEGGIDSSQHPNLGGKNIGLLYSYVLHINNFIGPAMVMFPYVIYQTGWFLSLVCFFLICTLASFTSVMVCEAIRLRPGNRDLRVRLEYLSLVLYYYPDRPKFYKFCTVLFVIVLQAFTIASVIVGVLIVDNFIAYLFG